MSNTMQNLHNVGLNPFSVELLAESMLKSSYVKYKGVEPLTFEFPVRRSDCAGWAGVRITIEAVPMPEAAQGQDAAPAEQPQGGMALARGDCTSVYAAIYPAARAKE